MLSQADRNKAADILMAAQKERKQAVQLTTTFPAITIEDSYAISTEVANRKIAAGARLIGHKVGLTSKAMQRSSMIDEPDFGYHARRPDDRRRRQGEACRLSASRASRSNSPSSSASG